MAELPDKKKIRQVFHKVQKHLLIEQLIRRFSTNKEDIRKKALTQTDLSLCKNVLELGCAFGSFTEALKDRLHQTAQITGLDIVPEYKSFFLEACKHAGYKGSFSSSGINSIKKISAASFDLVICSFALYFFVEMIPEIARILKKNGIFIAITHSQSNMQELIGITRKILEQNELLNGAEQLPIEVIIRQFSAENGQDFLSKSFGRVIPVDFKNKLIFQRNEINFFIEYFHFKSPFFLTGTNTDSKIIANELIFELQNLATEKTGITMCKDDRIFICSQPLITKEQV
jgi:ubiquinone/menaquinone biosynthesis C-methylase UbiE